MINLVKNNPKKLIAGFIAAGLFLYGFNKYQHKFIKNSKKITYENLLFLSQKNAETRRNLIKGNVEYDLTLNLKKGIL